MKSGTLAAGLALVAGLWVVGSTGAKAQIFSNNAAIALMDNCDAASFPPGLCVQVTHRSDVGIAEFLSVLYSPLYKNIVGHPSWRFEPSYLDIREGQTLRIDNKGADSHTFTEVANFGGGFVPGLNGAADPSFPPNLPPPGTTPLVPAPECVSPAIFSTILAPGQGSAIKPGKGTRKYQCCIHPWMRAVVGIGS